MGNIKRYQDEEKLWFREVRKGSDLEKEKRRALIALNPDATKGWRVYAASLSLENLFNAVAVGPTKAEAEALFSPQVCKKVQAANLARLTARLTKAPKMI